MKYLNLFTFLVYESVAYRLISLYASSDTSDFIATFFTNTSNVYESFDDYSTLLKIQPEEIDFLLLFPQNEIDSTKLSSFASTSQIPSILFWPGQSESNFTIFSDNPPNCLARQVSNLITSLNLAKVAIIWSYSEQNLLISKEIKMTGQAHIEEVSLNHNFSLSDITSTLSKVFKYKGFQHYLFLGSDSNCGMFQKAFEQVYLNIEGNSAIFIEDCFFSVNMESSLLLISQEKKSSQSKSEYFYSILKQILNYFLNPGLSKVQISRILEKFIPKCQSYLINIKEGTKEIIGQATSSSLTLTQAPIYFNGVENLTSFGESKIKYSGNTGTFNPLGQAPNFANQRLHQGTYFAVGKINREKTLLPNHELTLYDKIDCGVNVFDFNYSKECFIRHRPYMGVAYIPSFFPITMSVHGQLMAMNKSIPMIAGGGSPIPLSNKTVYPYFIRMVSPSSSYASAWANLVNIYGWDKVILHSSNDSFGQGIANVLISSQETYKYKIINDQKYWAVNNSNDNSTIPLYYEHIKASIDLGCNIIFLAMTDPTPFFWIEGFYDMGVRRGDLTFIVFTLTGLDSFASLNGNIKKRKELMHGSFVVLNAAWIGEYGENTKKEYLEYYQNPWSRSTFVDASLAVAHTLNFLLDQGQIYEDIKIFMNAARNIRFIGTSGTISFDSEANNRNLIYFNLFNFYEDEYGQWHDDAVALISPLGSVYYTVVKETVWAGGSLPKSMKSNYKNCPFPKSQIQDSKSGLAVKISICLSTLLIITLLTLYVLKHLNYSHVQMLITRTYITFPDYLTLGFIFIESLQIIAIGPSFSQFNRFLNNLSEILSMSITKVANFEGSTFWIIYFVMLVLSYLWLLLLLISSWRLIRLPGKVLNRLNKIKQFSIPIFSNYLFLPAIVSMISILMCDKASGDQIDDAYLNYDCNKKCWKKNHVVLVIFSCILLCIYVPVAILYRTIWQNEDLNLNIKTDSAYLITKTISVVALVVVGKVLKEDYKLAHSVVFIAIEMTMFVIVIWVRRAYNFDRANLWAKTMILCVVWNCFICTLGFSLNIEDFALVILQIVGWVSICISALIFQHKLPPSLLVSSKGRSIVELFRFAFGIQAYEFSKYLEVGEDDNYCEQGSRISES